MPAYRYECKDIDGVKKVFILLEFNDKGFCQLYRHNEKKGQYTAPYFAARSAADVLNRWWKPILPGKYYGAEEYIRSLNGIVLAKYPLRGE